MIIQIDEVVWITHFAGCAEFTGQTRFRVIKKLKNEDLATDKLIKGRVESWFIGI